MTQHGSAFSRGALSVFLGGGNTFGRILDTQPVENDASRMSVEEKLSRDIHTVFGNLRKAVEKTLEAHAASLGEK